MNNNCEKSGSFEGFKEEMEVGWMNPKKMRRRDWYVWSGVEVIKWLVTETLLIHGQKDTNF